MVVLEGCGEERFEGEDIESTSYRKVVEDNVIKVREPIAYKDLWLVAAKSLA